MITAHSRLGGGDCLSQNPSLVVTSTWEPIINGHNNVSRIDSVVKAFSFLQWEPKFFPSGGPLEQSKSSWKQDPLRLNGWTILMELSVRNIAFKIWYKMRKTLFNIPIDINFFPLWSINLYCNVWQQHNILWVFCARENSIFPQYPPLLSTNPFCLLITSPFSSTVYYFYVCLYTTCCVFFQFPYLPHLTANIGKRFFLLQLSTSTRRVSLSFVRFEQSILTVNLVAHYSKENDVVSSINQTQHIIRKNYWFLWPRW